jgi:hypothetical protein
MRWLHKSAPATSQLGDPGSWAIQAAGYLPQSLAELTESLKG